MIPLAFIGVGINGLVLVRDYARDAGCCVWASPYGLTGVGLGSGTTHLVLPQAYAFLVAGAWLGWRRRDPDSRVIGLLLNESGRVADGRGRPRWGLLLLVIFGMVVEMLGRTYWLDTPWWNLGLDGRGRAHGTNPGHPCPGGRR